MTGSEAKRHWPKLRAAGYRNKRFMVDSTFAIVWHPHEYEDPKLARFLSATEPFTTSRSERHQYGSALKKAGFQNRTFTLNGATTRRWVPPNYADPRLASILAAAQPVTLSGSDASRWCKSLRAAEWTHKQNVWLPKGYTDPKLAKIIAAAEPIVLSQNDGRRFCKALKSAGFSRGKTKVDGVERNVWRPPAIALTNPA